VFGEIPQTQEDSGQSGSTDSSQLELAGTGTGFFFESSGYILTNQHVVADASQVKVQVEGYDEPFIAEVVGEDADQDLAVLKISGTEAFPTLAIGDSNQTAIGDWVIAIGNPYGFDHTMTVGVLSAKERPITISDEDGDHVYEHLLQTDASINPGNSGGPLLNASGQVIGINTAVNSEAQGIGFAIPTSTIQEALKQLVGHNV
jgi:S1-C subfamily serine protease